MPSIALGVDMEDPSDLASATDRPRPIELFA